MDELKLWIFEARGAESLQVMSDIGYRESLQLTSCVQVFLPNPALRNIEHAGTQLTSRTLRHLRGGWCTRKFECRE
jgi:hypothetical protein